MSNPCVKGAVKLSDALDSMQLAYNPITKQLQFLTPKVDKKSPEIDSGSLSKKGSFSDEGISVSTCEKSDASDSPKSTLLWTGHQRGKDGGSFSSTVSSLSEYSLSAGYASKDEEEAGPVGAVAEGRATSDDRGKFKKKGLSGFFSRGVFPWRSGGGAAAAKGQDGVSGVAWRLFGSKSSGSLSAEPQETQLATPGSSATNTPRHRRHGSSASEKQFQDLVASSIALIQHERPSNLPAKTCEEALRHRAEHARIMEAARRRGEREAAARRARQHEALRQEEALARHAREWTASILPDWDNMKSSKRTLELWSCGLPPSIRGKVWQLTIENKLNVTLDVYHDCVRRAKLKLQEAQQRRKRLKVNRNSDCKDCSDVTQSRDEVDICNIISDSDEKIGTAIAKADKTNTEESDRLNQNIDKESETSGNTIYFLSKSDGKDRIRRLNQTTDKESKTFGNCQNCFSKSDDKDQIRRLNENTDKESETSGKCQHCLSKSDDKDLMRRLNQNTDKESEILGSCQNRSCKSDDKDRRLEDKDRLKPDEDKKSMYRNLSEQNLKSHSIDVEPSKKNSRSNPNLLDYGDECSMELIQLDIARTFPHLCIFQPGGPYFDVLHELLAAYVCYRPDVGYVQGMSFLGAMLILNMEAPQAFICFANLLDGPVLKAAYTRDGATMQKLWNAYTALLNYNLPALAGRIAPELYLLEWLYTAFAKAMPLDAACRVWDLFLRHGDTTLFRSALGVLHLYQDILKEMDFISAAQFLTKLPEDLSSDALFRSVSCISMTLDGLSFEELAASCDSGEHGLDECRVERL